MIRGKIRQPVNDGVVRIYSTVNVSESGEYPDMQPVHKETLRYKERTVGIKRFMEAKQANADVKYVLRVPLRRSVSALDIAVPNDGERYEIFQVQYTEDISPPAMDLTLILPRQTFDTAEGDNEDEG